MELDTGASYSLISEQMYKATWPEGAPSLEQSTVKLHTYTGEQVVVVGSITVTVLLQCSSCGITTVNRKG